MRKKAMERFGETKSRKVDEGELVEKKRKRRRMGSDTVEFLKYQSELRERELELERGKQEKEEKRHNEWKDLMVQQMAQQQEQIASFQMMMMQQNNLLLQMLEKKS